MSYNHSVFHATTFLSYGNYYFLIHSNCDSEKSSYAMQKINISISKFKFWFIAACLPPLLMRGEGNTLPPPHPSRSCIYIASSKVYEKFTKRSVTNDLEKIHPLKILKKEIFLEICSNKKYY